MSKPQFKPSPPLHPLTPPASVVDGSRTSPQSEEKLFTSAPRILDIFRNRKEGKAIDYDPWTTFNLSEGEFEEIERQIERDEPLWAYVQDKERYDFDAHKRRFVIRMPTARHDRFIHMVSGFIEQQLQEIGNGSSNAAAFARQVKAMSTTDSHYPRGDGLPGKSKHSPDAQFRHTDAAYPGVIIEVSYSQKRKDLRRLANTYIGDSQQSVRALVGLDIEYGPKATSVATVSVWRPQMNHATKSIDIVLAVDNEPFRDEEGNATSFPGIQLRLSEFYPPPFAQDPLRGEDRDITVTAQQLCQFLTEAEYWLSADPRGLVGIPTGWTIRRLVSSSPETITSEDETRFQDQEDEDDERASDADPEWETPETARRRRPRRG